MEKNRCQRVMKEAPASNDFVDSFRRYQQFDNWFLAFHPLSKLNILCVLGLSSMLANNWKYGFPLCILYCIFAFTVKRGRNFIWFDRADLRILYAGHPAVLCGRDDGIIYTLWSLSGYRGGASQRPEYRILSSGIFRCDYPVLRNDRDAGSDVCSGTERDVP